MGFINLLHNGYRGKLGQTVGQKWKGELTLRTYQEHNNSKSPAQVDQRNHYKTLISEASAHYPALYTTFNIKPKGMNYFNMFTSFWEKTKKYGTPAYPGSPFFKPQNTSLEYVQAWVNHNGLFVDVREGFLKDNPDVTDMNLSAIFLNPQSDPPNQPLTCLGKPIQHGFCKLTSTLGDPDRYVMGVKIPGNTLIRPIGYFQVSFVKAGKNRYSKLYTPKENIPMLIRSFESLEF